MSTPIGFLNAGREIQRFIYNMSYNFPRFESIDAILAARRFNTTIRERTSEDFQDGPGKLRALKVSYYPIQCDVVSDDNTIDICSSGDVLSPVQNWYTIQKLLKSKTYTLYPDDLRAVDGSFQISTHAASQFASVLGSLEKQLAIDITTDVIAHKGLHLDGTEYGQRVQAYNTASGIAVPGGFWQIQKEQMDGAYTNTFYLGHTEVFYWRKAMSVATDNTTLGQNFRDLAVNNLYYDVYLNQIMNVNPATDGEYILTYDPQALKFVSWNRNAGLWATDLQSWEQAFDGMMRRGFDGVARLTFASAKYDLLWDLFINYQPCVTGQYSGQYNWHWELNWDILYTPIQTCNAEGVNGIMLYRTCPVVVPNCPTGTNLSVPADVQTFTWNPPISYPYTVYNLLIAGQQSYPNATVASDAELVALFNSATSNNITFELDGSNVSYDGYSAISGSINGTSFTFS